MEDRPCCEAMKAQLNRRCAVHRDPGDCPDALIGYLPDRREHGIYVHDGGGSLVVIRFCPWCGTDLCEDAS
jgi:hypothetical protein